MRLSSSQHELPAAISAVSGAAVGLNDAADPGRDRDAAQIGRPPVSGGGAEDLRAVRVAAAGASADPVKDHLKQIGKVPLLNAEQEVELAKRIEAGLFAEEKLAEGTGDAACRPEHRP